MSEKPGTFPPPPDRDPTATVISVYGNNAAVACPCGKVVVVRSAPEQGARGRVNHTAKSTWECWCGRRYKGLPEGGQRITHLLVWDQGATFPGQATYRVAAACSNQLDKDPIAT